MREKHDIAALRAAFHYRPETGCVYENRRSRAGGRLVRRRVGWYTEQGYRKINHQKVKYREHRLIFALMTGRWPENVDHRNCVRDDNRWANLREASVGGNNSNSHRSSGRKGAILRPSGRWEGRIQVGGKYHYLGHFDTEQEAHEAYAKAAKEKFGEFARTWPACLD